MKEIWIVGAGRFGLLAAERLSRHGLADRLVLVDTDDGRLRDAAGPGRELQMADGAAFLATHMRRGAGPEWIVPAVPIHLAAEWCLASLGPGRWSRVPVPTAADSLVPNAVRGANGDVYGSHASFLCPDDCAEPRDLCTVTGLPRNGNLFELLAGIQVPGYRPLVVRSYQLCPGVGGYRPEALFSVLSSVGQAEGKVLVATACRCHGVVTGLGDRSWGH